MKGYLSFTAQFLSAYQMLCCNDLSVFGTIFEDTYDVPELVE